MTRLSALRVPRLALMCPLLLWTSLEAQSSAGDSTANYAQAAATARTDTLAPADSAPPASATAAAANPNVVSGLAGISLHGYAEASYTYSSQPNGTAVVGRIFDRMHSQSMLNALKVVLDRPFATDKLDAGFHTDIIFGQDASTLQSGGFKLGDQGDITQLYVTLNLPTANGNGIQFKAGKIATLMGLEVIEDVVNPTWSEGNQFIYVENFTSTGLEVDYKFNKYLDAELRVSNGWDVVQDNNNRKSFMGRLGIAPDDKTSLALVGFSGPEEPLAIDSTQANRYGIDALLNQKLGGKTSVWIQGDYGTEKANAALPDPTKDAKWWGLGGWVTYDFTPKLGIGLRGDYINDRDGARTSGILGFPLNTGQKFGSGTLSLNIRAWQGALVRPEVRYDRSSLLAFNGKKDQVTFALSAAYLY